MLKLLQPILDNEFDSAFEFASALRDELLSKFAFVMDPKDKECVKSLDEHISGIRRYTFFIYLNDVEKGGETDFKHAGFKVKPECGKGILWKNTINKGNIEITNFNAFHAGLPPIKSEKWGMNIWIRSKPIKFEY